MVFWKIKSTWFSNELDIHSKKETDVLFVYIYGIILPALIVLTLHFSPNNMFYRTSLFNNVFSINWLYFMIQICHNSFHQYLIDECIESPSGFSFVLFLFVFSFLFGGLIFQAIVQFKQLKIAFLFCIFAFADLVKCDVINFYQRNCWVKKLLPLIFERYFQIALKQVYSILYHCQ